MMEIVKGIEDQPLRANLKKDDLSVTEVWLLRADFKNRLFARKTVLTH